MCYGIFSECAICTNSHATCLNPRIKRCVLLSLHLGRWHLCYINKHLLGLRSAPTDCRQYKKPDAKEACVPRLKTSISTTQYVACDIQLYLTQPTLDMWMQATSCSVYEESYIICLLILQCMNLAQSSNNCAPLVWSGLLHNKKKNGHCVKINYTCASSTVQGRSKLNCISVCREALNACIIEWGRWLHSYSKLY